MNYFTSIRFRSPRRKQVFAFFSLHMISENEHTTAILCVHSLFSLRSSLFSVYSVLFVLNTDANEMYQQEASLV